MDLEINMNKMDFIICYNDALYLEECQRYIESLYVPEDMSIEVLAVSDAVSMCAGYQAAMKESDAKYKVYLHQDVFILNKNFIEDVVSIFQNHKEYGILGVLGGGELIKSGRYWDTWYKGKALANNSLATNINGEWGNLAENKEEIEQVAAIDGMIMITQYDIDWREDIFTDFDFYDISQCMEFMMAGYKVGVPYQKVSWCLHDCGHSKFDNYERNRKKFCETYSSFGYIYEPDEEMFEKIRQKKQMDEQVVYIEEAFKVNDYERAIALLCEALSISIYHTKCCTYLILLQIYEKEYSCKLPIFSFAQSCQLEDILQAYQKLRFLLYRLEFGIALDGLEHEWEWARKQEHLGELEIIVQRTSVQKQAVLLKCMESKEDF